MPTAPQIWSFRKNRSVPKRTATELYGCVVAWARAPELYGKDGVPDTPEGRLELVLLHVTLLLHRLKSEGPAAEPLARSLAEAFVTDMDDCLREMGVGDMTVAKKVKKAAAALFDRTNDYATALKSNSNDALADLITAHVVGADNAGAASRLAAYARKSSAQLSDVDVARLSSVMLNPAMTELSADTPIGSREP